MCSAQCLQTKERHEMKFDNDKSTEKIQCSKLEFSVQYSYYCLVHQPSNEHVTFMNRFEVMYPNVHY